MGEKRGAISVAMIVSIILAIAGFTILFLFYYNFQWRQNIEREVCHESVIFRATVPVGTKGYIPLKCQTTKICITSKAIGGADCTEEFGTVKGIRTVRVNNEQQIEKFIAQDVLDCWSMMGEGKVDLFSERMNTLYGLKWGGIYPTCVICSRVAFAKDIKDMQTEENPKINLAKVDVQQYMSLHKMPDSELTYSEYLSDGRGPSVVNDIFNVDALATGSGQVNISQIGLGAVEVDESLLDKETAILFMQIVSPKQWGSVEKIVKDMGLVVGASFILSPKMSLTAFKATSWWTVGILAIGGIYQQGSVAYNRAVTAGYCGSVGLGTQARDGCSIVRTVNYDAESISEYCKAIESIP